MVWSKMRPTAAVLLLFALATASFPTGSAETEPQVFFSDPFDDLSGWTFEGDSGVPWGLTTDRAHNGTALYLGDDQGTSDPEDNRFDCFQCHETATSPAIALPADSQAFLYFWAFVEIDVRDTYGFRVAVTPTGGSTDVIEALPQVKGDLVRLDLGAYAGETVRVSFIIDQFWSWRDEGFYLDDVLVTDLDVPVAHWLKTESEGPAADLHFTVPESGTKGVLGVRQEGGSAGSSIGAQFFLFHEGRLVYGGGLWVRSIGPDIDVDLLGEEVLRHNATSGNWGIRVRATLDLGELEPGRYRLVSLLHGTTVAQSQSELYVSGQLDAVQQGLGGEELAYATYSDFDSALVHVAVAGESLIMMDGEITREADGRAVGMIRPRATYVDAEEEVPEGASGSFGVHFTEDAGTWRLRVHRLVGGDGFPVFQLIRLPELGDPVDLPALDTSALPIGEKVGGSDPEPEPEPEPWPAGYTVNQTQRGFVACSVGAGPARTSDLCGAFHPDSDTVLDFPLDNGTTEITLELTSPGGPFADTPLCATVMRPVGIHTAVCTGDGPVTVWSAPEGEALTDGVDLVVDVRIARDGGLAYEQPFDLVVVSDHWGGQA